MDGGQHQLVGGVSLEMRRGRKTDYLDIPLKDSIKGWRLEWFIVENHGNSDFVFKNIQPLKDRAYPTYLYRGLADSTRVTNRKIPAVDLVS
jgi:hypothetical protein